MNSFRLNPCGLDAKLGTAYSPRKAGDVATVYADTIKDEAEPGYKAEYGIEDMCRDSWSFVKHNYEK